MAHMILGVFNDQNNASNAIDELRSSGYDPAEEISIVTKDRAQGEQIADDTGARVGEGAWEGAKTGGFIGALAGLLVGIGAIAVPGIGALFIAGPIAAALGLTGAAATTVSGGITGALAGGLVGALISLGLPEEDARYYENQIKQGGILVAVSAQEGTDNEVKDILQRNSAAQIREVNTMGS